MTAKPLLVYLQKFMDRVSLFPSSGRAVVGVSGGRDSMLLLFCLYGLQKQGRIKILDVVHINHHLREDSFKDGILVRKVCDLLGISCKTIDLYFDSLKGNLEKRARDGRYKEFLGYLQKGDRLYLAHHIDDSLEWSLLQSFRSGGLKSSLGIPLKRGPIVRPFMCLDRKQITFWAKKLKVPWREDTSNLNLTFERNYLRKEIIPKMAVRHPRYLKHYVDRFNKLAGLLGVSAFHGKETPWTVQSDKFGGISLIHSRLENNFVGAKQLITHIIEKLSKKERGTLSQQIDKMILAVGKGRMGPLIFSGGVYGFMQQGILCFLTEQQKKQYQKLDKILSLKIDAMNINHILEVNFSSLAIKKISSIPSQMVFGRMSDIKFCTGRRDIHPLWPLTSKTALKRNLWFQCLSRLLYFWSKKGKEGALPVASSDYIIKYL